MSKKYAETPYDRLSELLVDKENASKASLMIAGIKSPEIRDIFAALIESKVSDGGCRKALIALIDLDPEAAKAVIENLAITNSSALRQALAKGFDLPSSGRRSVPALPL